MGSCLDDVAVMAPLGGPIKPIQELVMLYRWILSYTPFGRCRFPRESETRPGTGVTFLSSLVAPITNVSYGTTEKFGLRSPLLHDRVVPSVTLSMLMFLRFAIFSA